MNIIVKLIYSVYVLNEGRKMKILISVQHFSPAIGGAEYSLLTLAEYLSEKHDIYVLQSGRNDDIKKLDKSNITIQKIHNSHKLISYNKLFSPWWVYHISPVIFQAKRWKKILENKINDIKPDLIITQLNFAPPSIDIAVKYDIPSIIFIRSYEHFCFVNFINGTDCTRQCKKCINLQNKIHFFAAKTWLEWNKKAIRNANLVIANSNYVSNITREWYGVNPIVLYPNIYLKKYKCEQYSRKYITIINPTKSKGIDIFVKIAESCPLEKFLVISSNKKLLNVKKIAEMSNVKVIEWTNRIEDIYGETKVLLVPVEWPEPFGRTVVEAGINGIPTIASKRGGLPEAVGDGGILIDDIYNTHNWIEAIQLLDDKKIYEKLSENAQKHAQDFDAETAFINFKENVGKSIGIYL